MPTSLLIREDGELGWTSIVSSQVEITATVGGKDTTTVGSFAVQSRIGQVAGWMDAAFPDTGSFRFAVTAPSPIYVKTMPPFSVKYPGFNIQNDSLLAAEGALGQTVLIYSSPPTIARPTQGPNAGVRFVNGIPWAWIRHSARSGPVFTWNNRPTLMTIL